jgi:HK97 family phage prohead protease
MIVRGYAAVFRNVDRQNEIVEPGAFSVWLAKGIRKVPLLWGHDSGIIPIGHTTYLKEDNVGLWYEAVIVDTAHGNDIAKLVTAGSLTASSFAYRTIDEFIDIEGVNHLVELELVEVSIVTWGANPKATVTVGHAEPEVVTPLPTGADILEFAL